METKEIIVDGESITGAYCARCKLTVYPVGDMDRHKERDRLLDELGDGSGFLRFCSNKACRKPFITYEDMEALTVKHDICEVCRQARVARGIERKRRNARTKRDALMCNSVQMSGTGIERYNTIEQPKGVVRR